MTEVVDTTTRAEIRESIGWLCQTAKRQFPKVGSPEHPTQWDLRHQAINDRLDDLEAATE